MTQSMPLSSNYSAASVSSAEGGAASKDAGTEGHPFSFPLRAFQASRVLLKSAMIGCPSVCIGRTLDLFHGADLVLSVLERVEGVGSSGGVRLALHLFILLRLFINQIHN